MIYKQIDKDIVW